MSTLGTAPVRSLAVVWPRAGAWRADVTLEGGASGAEAPTVGERVTLTVGTAAASRAFVGTVIHSGLDAPGLPHVVLQGGAGWERLATSPLAYQSDAGVRLSTVLRDLATRAGEAVEQPADRILGTTYALHASRYADPMRLRDALVSLARVGALGPWRADPDGTTRFGARSTDGQAVAVRATVLRRDSGVGLVVLGIDDPSGIAPGMLAPVSATETAVVGRLVVVESSGKLEAEAWE